MKFIFSLVFFSLCMLPFESIAQRNNNNLISLPVSVSDREGRYIPGLKKEDFTIYEDGKRQNIAFFATYDEPLNIVLLLDTSGSTQGEVLEKIKDAAKDFADLLKPNDRCLVASFDAEVKIHNQFTNQEGVLKKAIDKVQTADRDGTVLFRAVKEITQNAFNDVDGRKVIVLLSDGKDYNGDVKFKELMSVLEESDVLVYSIYYQTGSSPSKLTVANNGAVKETKSKTKEKKPKEPKKPKTYYSVIIPPQADLIDDSEIRESQKLVDLGGIFALQEMSEMTAGRFYQSDTPNLRNIFRQVAAELREQYRLGYYAKDAANHDIIVKVARADAVVRTRERLRGK